MSAREKRRCSVQSLSAGTFLGVNANMDGRRRRRRRDCYARLDQLWAGVHVCCEAQQE